MIPAVRKYKIRRLKRMVERLKETRLDKEFNEEDHPRTMGKGHEGEFTRKEEVLTPSQKKRDKAYRKALASDDMKTAQKLVRQAAREAGYTVEGWHGTGSKFTKFSFGRAGIYITTDEDTAKTYGSKVMHLYGTENNQLVVDAKGEGYLNVPVSDELGAEIDRFPLLKGKRDTDTIARVAKRLGYSSVKFANIDDSFSSASNFHNASDEYCYFESLDELSFKNSQVKSANTIVRDDDGDVIPLSQRFPHSSSDIRGYGNISNKKNEIIKSKDKKEVQSLER